MIPLEEITAREQELLQTIWDQEKQVGETEKELSEHQNKLHSYQRSVIPHLFQEALQLLKDVEETPTEVVLLTRYDGFRGMSENPYSQFSLPKLSDGRVMKVKGDYTSWLGRNFWREQPHTREVVTLEQLLTPEEMDNECINKMYWALKEFVITYGTVQQGDHHA